MTRPRRADPQADLLGASASARTSPTSRRGRFQRHHADRPGSRPGRRPARQPLMPGTKLTSDDEELPLPCLQFDPRRTLSNSRPRPGPASTMSNSWSPTAAMLVPGPDHQRADRDHQLPARRTGHQPRHHLLTTVQIEVDGPVSTAASPTWWSHRPTRGQPPPFSGGRPHRLGTINRMCANADL